MVLPALRGGFGREYHYAAAVATTQRMLPESAATGQLVTLRRDDSPVSVTRRTVKGVDYVVFNAAAGDYVAAYGPGDGTPPETTIADATVAGSGAHFSFSSN